MKKQLCEAPVHLGRNGGAESMTAISGMGWYQEYAERTEKDGADGRLVSEYAMDADWDHWEMHPVGAEIVYCLSGRLRLHQEGAGAVELEAGEYVINPPGVWHTADILEPGRALFITAGQGAEHKPR